MSLPVVLSIAASDSSAGAGIQADIKTCMALNCYCVTIVTGITAQNTQKINEISAVKSEILDAQWQALFNDVSVNCIKVGALCHEAQIAWLAEKLMGLALPTIIDPIFRASSGKAFIASDCIDHYRDELLPQATLLTPNLPEAMILTQQNTTDKDTLAKALLALGPKAVLLKGGHFGDEVCTDTLYFADKRYEFVSERIYSQHTHGTGCTLSSAIASYYCRLQDWPQAVKKAKAYLQQAIITAQSVAVGQGCNGLNHNLAQELYS